MIIIGISNIFISFLISHFTSGQERACWVLWGGGGGGGGGCKHIKIFSILSLQKRN